MPEGFFPISLCLDSFVGDGSDVLSGDTNVVSGWSSPFKSNN